MILEAFTPVLWVLLGAPSASPRDAADAPARPFQQQVEYRIAARLNTREHLLFGETRIRYTNRSPDRLDRIFLHLDANKYRDRYSTAAREKAFYHDETIRQLAPDERGYLDVERLEVEGEPIPYQVVDTVLSFSLPRPLVPGASLEIHLEWLEKVRAFTEGGGRSGRRYELTDWYPRVAVYGHDGWQVGPAHDLGGRHTAFASFHVTLDVPRDYVIGATGLVVRGDPGWRDAAARAEGDGRPGPADPEPGGTLSVGLQGSRKSVELWAEHVNDFAWVADPDLRLEEVVSDGRTLRVLYPAEAAGAWRERVLARSRTVLDWYEGRVGPYPYPQLTVLASPGREARAFPMLLLLGGAEEGDLARALGRHYFGAALGTDPVHSAWLSEGFATFSARSYLVGAYGPAGRSPHELDGYARRLRQTPARDRAQQEVLRAAGTRMDEPVATTSHLFRDRDTFRPAVRNKASLFLDALRFAAGPEAFDRALRATYRAWLGREVSEGTWRAALEGESGQALGPLFDAWLYDTRTADAWLERVRVRARETGGYDLRVVARRRGETATAVDLLVRSADGAERRLRASGAPRQEWTLELEARPTLVWLDPDSVLLEHNRLDNRWPRALEWAFAWPFADYTPRDAYLVTARPALWYNLGDGLRAGAVLAGTQEGRWHDVLLAPSVGWKTGRVDWLARYRTELRELGRTEVEAELHKAEGRRLVRALLSSNLSARLARRPQTRVEAGLQSFEVTQGEYLRPARFEPGTVNQLWFRVSGDYAGPGWISTGHARYQFSGPQLESDYSFNRLSGSLSVRSTGAGSVWMLRGFVGLSSDGDRLPREERFFLGGAGPMEEFRHPGLRSQDSPLTFLNYHLPGDGNFRAYGGYATSARRLFTVNLENQRPFGWPGPLASLERYLGQASLAWFGDMGKAEGTGVAELGNPLFGLGVGVRFEPVIQGRKMFLRLDFPFYANRPGFDEEGRREGRTEPRWLVSLEPAL